MELNHINNHISALVEAITSATRIVIRQIVVSFLEEIFHQDGTCLKRKMHKGRHVHSDVSMWLACLTYETLKIP